MIQHSRITGFINRNKCALFGLEEVLLCEVKVPVIVQPQSNFYRLHISENLKRKSKGQTPKNGFALIQKRTFISQLLQEPFYLGLFS